MTAHQQFLLTCALQLARIKAALLPQTMLRPGRLVQPTPRPAPPRRYTLGGGRVKRDLSTAERLRRSEAAKASCERRGMGQGRACRPDRLARHAALRELD